MNLAVFSDIHGNLPALNAVLKDIDERQIDQLICLGDLVDFAPWPNEVIRLIRYLRVITVMGNHDERIAYDLPIIIKPEQGQIEASARFEAITLTKDTVDADNKIYLRGLPRHLTLGFQSKEIYFTHASPRGINEYIYQSDSALQRLSLGLADADMLVIGHTHLPYIAEHEMGTVFNVGSVGRSKEEDNAATYGIIHIGEDSRLAAEIVRVRYDWQQTATAIIESAVPDFYANSFGITP